jgi:hypothetical protein
LGRRLRRSALNYIKARFTLLMSNCFCKRCRKLRNGFQPGAAHILEKIVFQQLSNMSHYFLDNSVASMILDGDLWRRDPQRLVRYKPELKFSSHMLYQMEEKEEAVRSVVKTLSWAKSVSQAQANVQEIIVKSKIRETRFDNQTETISVK